MAPTGLNWEHLRDEIAILRLCLLRELQRFSQHRERRNLDSLQGLVLSEEEIVSILAADPVSRPGSGQELDQQIEELTERMGQRVSPDSPTALQRLSSLFRLERFEQQCLLLCLAGDIQPSFAKVYAFLHDDVNKRLPTVELACRLFTRSEDELGQARLYFSAWASLREGKLVHLQEVPDLSCPLSQRWFNLDDRIAGFLLESDALDSCLEGWVEFVAPEEEREKSNLPSELADRTEKLAEFCFGRGRPRIRPILHLKGRYGSGRREVAERVARRLGVPLLVADAGRIPSSADRADTWWRLGRESRLRSAALLVEHFDELLEEGRMTERRSLLDAARRFSPLTFLSGSGAWRADEGTQRQFTLSLDFPEPDAQTRTKIWKTLLDPTPHNLTEDQITELSSKFRFTGGQVRDAFVAAQHRALWESQPPAALDLPLIQEACRHQSTPNLGQLARRIQPIFGWDDIVLPASLLAQLKEIASHVLRADAVLDQWGFANKLAYGLGVTGLFHGGSGTGKTMAVSVIANELGLDLYKIDLSMVVSKYIGETEKNLNRVFAEAQDSNAILFFDEADALFGKRSEVKDAHDRYANIETAYLLQRMEEYNGIVILASNMKHNLDEAFVRRMRFILHFPFPTEKEREKIWKLAFPADAPLGKDVDFNWLARKLRVTGGYIKSISLRAAFLAADQKGLITMDCLKEAGKLEMEKIGKITDLVKFEPRIDRVPGPAVETAEMA